MAETYKILGQIAPAGTAETVLYTSPASTQALITNITVTNRTNSSQTFDINVYDSVKVSNDLIDVAGSTFVAVVRSSTKAASSTDGITWTLRTLPASISWQSVTYGNSTFVAVAYGSATAASSTDGITWTARTMPSSSWKAVTYGNSTFVAVEYYTTKAATSTDAITWTARTLPAVAPWRAVTFGNSTFVAVAGTSDSAASSTDGITWTARTLPSSGQWITATAGSIVAPYSSPAINNIYKTTTILANQSEILEPGITLAAQKTIVARGTSNLTISAYGVELS